MGGEWGRRATEEKLRSSEEEAGESRQVGQLTHIKRPLCLDPAKTSPVPDQVPPVQMSPEKLAEGIGS